MAKLLKWLGKSKQLKLAKHETSYEFPKNGASGLC